jgi:hypothetical protein
MKGLQELEANRENYDDESKAFIDSLRFVEKELGEINSMKSTQGWKLLDSKIRSELQLRITELVKDDLKIQTLIALLAVADTKTQEQHLEDEIGRLIPS